jgi:hypothetical protein
MLFMSFAARVDAQPAPWSGIAADDAAAYDGNRWHYGANEMWRRSLSADGRLVVFHSSVAELVPGDTNGSMDVFLRDRLTRELTRVSVAADGSEANGWSAYASMTADGRHIIFYSCASNLVPDDTNGLCDVFVRDRMLGTVARVNIGPDGESPQNSDNFFFSMSSDGRYVAFAAALDPASWWTKQVWLRDRDPDENGIFDEPGSSTTVQISRATVGSDSPWNAVSVAISGNGRVIAYTATTLDANSNDIGDRLYVYFRDLDTTVRIDRPFTGNDVQAYAYWPDLDETGAHVAYTTNAPDLVEGDAELDQDVFSFNLVTGGHTRIQLTHQGAPNLYAAYAPSARSPSE